MKKIGTFIVLMIGVFVTGFLVNKFLEKIELSETKIFNSEKYNSKENSVIKEEIEKVEKNKINSTINYVQVNDADKNKYQVFVDKSFTADFNNYNDAIEFAEQNEKSLVREKGATEIIWDNYPPFIVYINSEEYKEFDQYYEALAFAKNIKDSFMYFRKDNNLIWTSEHVQKESIYIEAIPNISQYPELPRGCEVTSLAMLLAYKNMQVDKLTLAEEIKKNNQQYIVENNKIFYGNPNRGFIGDMYNLKNPGLGVYHKPIYDLALKYAPYSTMDITGSEFNDILNFVSKGIPVWIITNTIYDELEKSEFQVWNTEDGKISVTYREHSVVIIGYDDKYIYFNDPHGMEKKIDKEKFRKAWEQMGKQAITFTS